MSKNSYDSGRLNLPFVGHCTFGKQPACLDWDAIEADIAVLGAPFDMYIEIAVETPVNLSKRQKELLEEFRKAGGEGKSTNPETEGFFSKVKEFWDDLTE